MMRFACRVIGGASIIVLLALSNPSLCQERPLVSLEQACPKKQQICSDYIKAVAPALADAIIFTMDSLDRQEEVLSDNTNRAWGRFVFIQDAVIALTFVSTLLLAFGRDQPALTRWAIVPTALAAAVTAFGSTYQYGAATLRDVETKSRLAELDTQIQLKLLLAASGSSKTITKDDIDSWNKQRDTILNDNLGTYLTKSTIK